MSDDDLNLKPMREYEESVQLQLFYWSLGNQVNLYFSDIINDN